jgi:drug/metabolite transporter (DMT)-like permease
MDAVERMMERHGSVMERSRSVLKQARSSWYGLGLFLGVAGVIFTILGAADLERFAFAFVLGITLLLFGVYWIILARRFPKDKPPEEEPKS